MTPKIFISYRRLDSQDFADRLYDYMVKHFGADNVFQDVGDSTKIPPGVDFVEYLAAQIRGCDVILVVIGEHWTRILQERAAREDDFVRIEVESALAQKKILIPVLKSNAQMPASVDLPASIKALARRNASRVRPNPDFARDCDTLAEGIRLVFSMSPPSPDTNPPTPEHILRLHTFRADRSAGWQPYVTTLADVEARIPGLEFCLVPDGTFQMGSDEAENERPPHPQTLSAFWLARYPVTNAQWRLAVQAQAVPLPKGDGLKWYKDERMADAPVVGVTWFEAQRFCQWLGLRLPTEPEWEYAARGSQGQTYPWGQTFSLHQVICSKNSGGRPSPVTSRPSGVSWVGAEHLGGNVWEWCSSQYAPYPYDAAQSENPAQQSRPHVLRGGSWSYSGPSFFRATYRDSFLPDLSGNDSGFRCARSL